MLDSIILRDCLDVIFCLGKILPLSQVQKQFFLLKYSMTQW